MTTSAEKERCGISSLFVMSCRGRADAFARRLHARLSSLGSQDRQPDETTWLTENENQTTVTQPRVGDPDLFLDISIIDPGSPQEGFENIITNDRDNLARLRSLSNLSSETSDSSDQYYELDQQKSDQNLSDSSFSSLEYSSCLPESETSRTITDDSFNSIEELTQTKDDEDKENQTENVHIKDDKEERLTRCIEENRNEINSSKDDCQNGDEVCDIALENHIGNGVTEELELLLLEDRSTDEGEDEVDREEATPRVRRCSSLKTGKTPPDTPGRKKIVRFADVLGLDLADVRTFLDEIPKIPNSAYDDLRDANLACLCKSDTTGKILVPLFLQPGGQSDFLQRVRENQVCLENAMVEDCALMCVKGTVRVRNMDFNKSVHIRYSLDGWKTYADLQCSYVNNSCDGFSDKFSFLFYANTLQIGGRLEFAVKYQCKGFQYWDNNRGANYCFQCLPTTSPRSYDTLNAEEPWSSSFYYSNNEEEDPEVENRHRHLAVQEYIAATLDKHKKFEVPELVDKKNPNLFTIFCIVVVSILFLYVQKAIYFT